MFGVTDGRDQMICGVWGRERSRGERGKGEGRGEGKGRGRGEVDSFVTVSSYVHIRSGMRLQLQFSQTLGVWEHVCPQYGKEHEL